MNTLTYFSRPMQSLNTARLILRFPQDSDATLLKAFEERNQAHLKHWESLINDPNEKAYQNKIATWQKEIQMGQSARFLLFKKDAPDYLLGMCNFTQIFYGPFQACYLGYKIDQAHEGQGYMLEALTKCISYMFEELKLHRVMANYMPDNEKSAHLLKRLGFTIEGIAKSYLLINNKWEDHVLTSLITDNW